MSEEKLIENNNRYNNSKIYKLIDVTNGYYYIGCSCLPLSKRLYYHKDKAKQQTQRKVYKYFNSINWENVKIILFQELYLNNREELLRAENDVIQAHINDPLCLNSNMSLVSEERKRMQKYEYRLNNKDKINELRRYQYKNNIEKRRQKSKEEYIKYKEQKIEYGKEYRHINDAKFKENHVCPCGGKFTYTYKKKHEKSKKHIAWLNDQKQESETI